MTETTLLQTAETSSSDSLLPSHHPLIDFDKEKSIKSVMTLPNGRFAPGHPHMGGRLPGRADFFPELIKSLRTAEKEHGKTLIKHAVDVAYKDNSVLVAMMKKILPDLTSETGNKGPQVVQIMMPHRGAVTFSDGETQISVEQRELISLGKLPAAAGVSQCAPARDRSDTVKPEAVFAPAAPANPIPQTYVPQHQESPQINTTPAVPADNAAVKSINA